MGSYYLTATIPTLFADSSSGCTDEHSVYSVIRDVIKYFSRINSSDISMSLL
jgi:hypothetical protein